MEFQFKEKFPGTYFCFDITITRRGLTIELVLLGTFQPSPPHIRMESKCKNLKS
jgi:hypothetical protein